MSPWWEFDFHRGHYEIRCAIFTELGLEVVGVENIGARAAYIWQVGNIPRHTYSAQSACFSAESGCDIMRLNPEALKIMTGGGVA